MPGSRSLVALPPPHGLLFAYSVNRRTHKFVANRLDRNNYASCNLSEISRYRSLSAVDDLSIMLFD
jgi:hypothetical protein